MQNCYELQCPFYSFEVLHIFESYITAMKAIMDKYLMQVLVSFAIWGWWWNCFFFYKQEFFNTAVDSGYVPITGKDVAFNQPKLI